ncbi:hypothetical protein [Formosa haliotis]|uniref:hypothetical protein n=1 Tax=Formosa haliotis TaxID=1555194 RepID=UPI000825B52E|nr:hypothetical protein [Formosa haliotis]
MEIADTLQEIKWYKEQTLNIPDTETLDDIKEMENYDYEITSLIFDYCLSKNYNINGFPEKYLDFIEQEDEDFYDFLSFEIKSYYGLKNALLHEEVLLLFKTFYYYPETSDHTDEAFREDILLEVRILEDTGVSLEFNKEEY